MTASRRAKAVQGKRRGPLAATRRGSRARPRTPVVTIDGPAAAGKSIVARELAGRLGFQLIDTGAMYRALALRVMRAGLAPVDGPALSALLERTTVELRGERVLLDGRDVSEEIRAPEVGELTSRLTALKTVRDTVTPIQRRLAARGGVVLEGRDTGSVVCPDADVKFYLDAAEVVRAERRRRELEGRGTRRSLPEVREEIAQRDLQDRGRALAPLVVPPGAVVIDSTGKSVDQVVTQMLEVVRRVECSTGS
ncbi:MAG: (d)CMP kinase [Candidatus Rokubacteria bacterium]|nr:(d)CMP kinase [Candidatus Rokubacteria bacterium]